MRTAWLAVLVAACGSSTPTTTTTTTAAPPPAPGDGTTGTTGTAGTSGTSSAADDLGARLADQLTVRSYAVQLAVDPDKPTFDGQVTLNATLAAPRRAITLHAERLRIATATATAGKAAPMTLTATASGKDKVILTGPRDFPEGDVTIVLTYQGDVDDNDTMGIFRQESDGRWYAFTQFEPLGARRAFPCIDEPAVKVPWTLTLDVPEAAIAVSNTPVASDAPTAGGMHRVTFETTRPLPSYLIALGVGPFDVVDAGKSKSGTPLRIIAPAGRAADAKIAAGITKKVADWLEDWFGMPYPYAKLDAMAIPITVSFGAMENVGLITYRADILLIKKDAPEVFARRYARIAAHEIAHQWFGDLVTPAWWDDIWLNESFATWLPFHTTDEVFPRWRGYPSTVETRGEALAADSLGTARRVRQPIASEDDIVTAFDGISYQKGAAVLRMFELWSGETAFRDGVRAYLKQHADGNATAADFLAAVSASTGKDLTGTMSTFLDQAGAPRLDVSMTCDNGRATFTVTQSRYLPVGAERPDTSPVWKLPVCVVYGAAGVKGGRHEACALVEKQTSTFEGEGCTAGGWMYANKGGNGYYRTAIVDALPAIAKDGWAHLTPDERLSVAQDVGAAIAAGETDITTMLGLVPQLVAGNNRPLVHVATKVVEGARKFLPQNDAAIARWVRTQFGPAARALGWKPKAGEPIDAPARREALVPLVAELGQDKALVAQALVLAKTWRKLPAGGSRGDLLRVAVRAKPELAKGLRDEFVASTSRVEHADLAVAIGRPGDRAELEAALALLLDERVDVREAALILKEASSDPLTQDWAQEWTVAHLDELIARYPVEGAGRLVGSLVTSCDAEQLAPMRAVADAKIVPLAGGKRWTEQAFEAFAQCVEQRKAVEPALEAWRKGLPAK